MLIPVDVIVACFTLLGVLVTAGGGWIVARTNKVGQVVGQVHQQVTNSHDSNLRNDMDDISHDVEEMSHDVEEIKAVVHGHDTSLVRMNVQMEALIKAFELSNYHTDMLLKQAIKERTSHVDS